MDGRGSKEEKGTRGGEETSLRCLRMMRSALTQSGRKCGGRKKEDGKWDINELRVEIVLFAVEIVAQVVVRVELGLFHLLHQL